jgi:hypothetical protein
VWKEKKSMTQETEPNNLFYCTRVADIVNDEYYWILHECHLMWHKFCTPWRLADTLRFRMVGAGIMIDERRG